MAIPREEDIQIGLLHLLANDPAGTIHCEDVYHRLANEFPALTWEELVIPYRASRSHWANRVQWARWHLVEKGWLLHPSLSGRGIWAISPAGREHIASMKVLADELLKELEGLD
jgi:restriction endonuclease Mrr